jgi:succinate dehydrogenase / fumarate reductase cytochrome b subunit
MSDAAKGPRERPMSPHLSVWRWHITMATSIAHRVTGMALYVGALIAAAWAISLAAGPETYAEFKAIVGSPIGLIVMFGLTLSFFYHFANGVRHLVWDAGHGLDVRNANVTSVAIFAFTVAATIGVWIVAGLTGAL